MNLIELVASKGARYVANVLVNAKIEAVSGGVFSKDDLPDTADLCSIVDELEAIIEVAHTINEFPSRKVVRGILSGITIGTIESAVYS